MNTGIPILIKKIREKSWELFGIDVRALATMRVGFALIILFDLANRARSLEAHYTDVGVLPRAEAWRWINTPLQIPFHFLSGSWEFQAVLFIIAGIFALMMLVGYRTRLATIASWILLVSLQNRNPLLLQGGDVLLRLCMFWAMFLPWGLAYSWDKMRQRLSDIPQVIFTAGTAGYLLQIGLVYVFAYLLKLPGKEWAVDRTAIYYALNIDQFTTSFGYALLKLSFLLPAMTAGVLWLEGTVFFLLFSPVWAKWLRTFGAASIIMLHTGMGLSMHLGPFPWVAGVAMLGFFPSFVWDAAANWLKKRERAGLTVYYDGECGFCRTAAHALPQFFFLQTARVLPASENESILEDMAERNSWVAVDETGKRYYEFDVIIEMTRRSPVLRFFSPLLRLQPIHSIGTRAYEFVAAHRKRTCVPDSQLPEQRPFRSHTLPVWASVAALWCLILIILWNITTLPGQNLFISSPFRKAALLLRLDQKWDMFAPYPLKADGWYVITGRLHNGMEINLFPEGKPVSWQKPAHVASIYAGERWRKYFMNLSSYPYARYREMYVDYRCWKWNSVHSDPMNLDMVEMSFMVETTLPSNRLPPPHKLILMQRLCTQQTTTGGLN